MNQAGIRRGRKPGAEGAGGALKALRVENNITQEQISQKLGIRADTVAAYEANRKRIGRPKALWDMCLELFSQGDLEPLRRALGIEKGPENLQQAEESPNPSQGNDSPPPIPDLFDLPAKQALWEEVQADARRLLGEVMRGYTDAKLNGMDLFLLKDRLNANGCDSGSRWVKLALKLPDDFPENNDLAFQRLIARQMFADAGFQSARKAFYGTT